ncbi:MAG TPA: hypothetical protein VK717_06365 [Opitutaceae bacterium]|nr:hypothetical protein [Opitutaceae bacterium]
MKVLEKIFPRGPSGWFFVLVGAAAFALLLGTYMRVWSPDYGITRFIIIGHEFNQRGLAAYRATPKYMDPYPPDHWGFDGQHYAQIALDPLLRDPQIKQAIDNPPYRARRIFLPWLAWIGGLGHPFWVINLYAGLNLVFWLGFVVMMAVLFRPHGWAGLAGFAAMLLTCGIIESMRGSLTDFPAFVLMILAVMIGGMRGAGVLALAGLTREVSVLGLAGLLEIKPPWRAALKKNLCLGVITVGPMLVWFVYIAWRLRMHASVDGDNLDWPMAAIGRKLGEFVIVARQGGIPWAQFYRSYELHALLTIIATLTQCIYLLTHRSWDNRLWRMAAVFVPLFLCIGYPAWESHFTVTRHALPITLGFNLFLAMRPSRRWLLWFLLGNCFVPYGVFQFAFYGRETPPRHEFMVVGAPADGALDIRSGAGWSGPESSTRKIWRWAVGQTATLVLSNAGLQPVEVGVAFDTTSSTPRDLRVSVGDTMIWSGQLDYRLHSVRSRKFSLPPGRTIVTLETSLPPASSGIDDTREFTFMLSSLQLVAARPVPAH